jgi:hypothetical protein
VHRKTVVTSTHYLEISNGLNTLSIWAGLGGDERLKIFL